jgi:hypothetical protein
VRRIAKLALTLVVLVAATAAGTIAANAVGTAPPEEWAAPDPAPVPGTLSVEARAADPDSAAAPWVVRTYATEGGQTCADFGREVDGKVGLLDGDGSFHERRPEDAGGNCGDPDAAAGLILAATFYPDDPTTKAYEAPRTILHGLAGSHVTSVEASWPDGRRQVELSPRGAFIQVYAGQPESVPVTVNYDDRPSETLNMTIPRGG